MPRANIEKHFVAQQDWGADLLKTPDCKIAIKAIKDAKDERGCVPIPLLSELTGIPVTSLSESNPKRDRGTNRMRLSIALKALREYLPRILHWKPLATFSKELGLHRNQVEKLARDSGTPRVLMYARDKRLYISPAGEECVRQRYSLLQSFGERPTPTEVAETHNVPLNLLTSYFSSRGITFEKDPLGRARLTLEQVVAFSEWRKDVAQRGKLSSKMIDGVLHESVRIAARRRAERLFLPNTGEYEKYAKSCEASLKHLAEKGGILRRTKHGAYIPADVAQTYAERVSVPEGARLVGVTCSTIKVWRKVNKKLSPNPLPGRYCIDIALDPLITFATQRYLEEPKLKKRDAVPSILIDFRVGAIAARGELDKRGLILNQPISKSAQEKILSRSQKIRRLDFEGAMNHLDRIEQLLTIQGGPEDGLLRSPGAQAQRLGHNLQILPAWKVIQQVREVAQARGCSPDSVYATIKEYFSLPTIWPTTFSYLEVLQKNGMSIPAFPLKVGASLESLLRTYRNESPKSLVS